MVKGTKIKCKIVNIELPNITVEFDDQKGPTWRQTFNIKPLELRVFSLEEFGVYLSQQRIVRPIDPFKYLKEAHQNGDEFTIVI